MELHKVRGSLVHLTKGSILMDHDTLAANEVDKSNSEGIQNRHPGKALGENCR